MYHTAYCCECDPDWAFVNQVDSDIVYNIKAELMPIGLK